MMCMHLQAIIVVIQNFSQRCLLQNCVSVIIFISLNWSLTVMTLRREQLFYIGFFKRRLRSGMQSTPPPPIPPLSGQATKRRYWKTAVKGVIYNQEKTYSGLGNQQQYWGGGGG